MKKDLLNYEVRDEEDIFRIASEVTGLREDVLKVNFSIPFKAIRAGIRDLTHDHFYLHGLGNFSTSLYAVNFHIRQWISAYRRGKITRELCVNKVSALWGIRSSLIAKQDNG